MTADLEEAKAALPRESDDYVASERDDKFDNGATDTEKDDYDYDDEYDPEDYQRARRKQVAFFDIILIVFIIAVIIIFAVALPFVLKKNNNEQSDESSVPNVTQAPNSMPELNSSLTIVPTAATPAPSFAASSYSVVGGPFLGAQVDAMFGFSASLDNGFAAVGAPLDDIEHGSVTIYEYDSTNSSWSKQMRYYAGAVPNDIRLMGYSVHLRNDRMIVGAPGTTEENAVTAGNGTSVLGAAITYKYESINNTWNIFGPFLRGAFDELDEQFGASVAMSSSDDPLIAVVGAPMRNDANGGVYTFQYDDINDNWVNMSEAPLADDTIFGGGMLGHVVTITADGTRILAGAPQWGDGIGKAIMYDWNATSSEWSKVWEAAGVENDAGNFGSAVTFLDSQTFAIGEPGASSGKGAVTVFQESFADDTRVTFEQLGPSIGGGADDAIGSTGTISGTTVNDSMTVSLLVATQDQSIYRNEYSGQQWRTVFASISDLGGPVTSVGFDSIGDAFIVGVSSDSTASIYDVSE
ncbi:hypothetical protein MPSEU_000906600 [Mayamaea pseudoterrestris]|nr:hypothetical protein MPSEU_000906600 [Mayamaea pseudoterrestris]